MIFIKSFSSCQQRYKKKIFDKNISDDIYADSFDNEIVIFGFLKDKNITNISNIIINGKIMFKSSEKKYIIIEYGERGHLLAYIDILKAPLILSNFIFFHIYSLFLFIMISK